MGTPEGDWARYQHYLEQRGRAAPGEPLTFEEWTLLSGTAPGAAVRAPGDGVPAAVAGLAWGDPESPAYGHASRTHGSHLTEAQMRDRARSTGQPQGHWHDDTFIVEAEQRAPLTPGEHVINMGRPVGDVYLPPPPEPHGRVLRDVSIVKVNRRPDGTVRSAYPFI
jgi:hypothetical protein